VNKKYSLINKNGTYCYWSLAAVSFIVQGKGKLVEPSSADLKFVGFNPFAAFTGENYKKIKVPGERDN
jgi:hypothetical protein